MISSIYSVWNQVSNYITLFQWMLTHLCLASLSNAIKYSPASDTVDLTIHVNDGNVDIQIEDYGLGIPEDVIEKLFTRFYRVDNSDRRQIGGTGLGLAICKEIMDAHNGVIRLIV